MDWKTLSKAEAISIESRWRTEGYQAFRQIYNRDTAGEGLSAPYKKLRKELVRAYYEAEKTVSRFSSDKKKEYLRDLLFGLDVYRILEAQGMNSRLASNRFIWIFLNVRVVPDLVFERFGESKWEKDGTFILPSDRLYGKPGRLYLKTLWWYIYLSLQFKENGDPDFERTREILWDNTTDTIVQLVERSGKEGYRVDMSRALMKYYAECDDRTPQAFRRAMVLNSARTLLIEPGLTADGDTGYVKELFEYQ